MLTLWQHFKDWFFGPDIFLDIKNTPNNRIISEIQERAQWLSDKQLSHLMDICEVEHVNRMALMAEWFEHPDPSTGASNDTTY